MSRLPAVIAPSMGDIFMANAAKNGLLTIILPAPTVARMMAATLATPGLEVAVDLEAQCVSIPAIPAGCSRQFEIDAYRKQTLLSGLDELGYTLTQLDKIELFERSYT